MVSSIICMGKQTRDERMSRGFKQLFHRTRKGVAKSWQCQLRELWQTGLKCFVRIGQEAKSQGQAVHTSHLVKPFSLQREIERRRITGNLKVQKLKRTTRVSSAYKQRNQHDNAAFLRKRKKEQPIRETSLERTEQHHESIAKAEAYCVGVSDTYTISYTVESCNFAWRRYQRGIVMQSSQKKRLPISKLANDFHTFTRGITTI